MRPIRSTLATAGLALAIAVGSGVAPVSAHHSFGHYDMTKMTEVEGVVSQWEWSNPHCWLFIVVDKPGAQPVTYGFELQSVGELLRRGWKKSSLKVGDKIKVSYRPMKDGTPAGLMQSVKDSSGNPIGNRGGPPPAGAPGAPGGAPGTP